jgi:hypothetical protein
MGLPESPKLLKGVNKIPIKKSNHQRILSKESNLSMTHNKYVTLQASDFLSPNTDLASNIKITSSRPNSKGSKIVLDIFNQFNGL